MPATLKDIAERLDLSISTVSYALNGGPKPVSAEVRRKVHSLARELDYRPNRIARSLVTRRTQTIGVVPIDVEQDIILHPCVHLALNGLINAAERLRQDVLLFTAHDRNLPDVVADDMLDSRVDGVVFIAPRPDSPALDRIRNSRLPYAIVAANDQNGPSYGIDNAQGTQLALEHLYALGHRRIGHIAGNLALTDSHTRLDTYRSFMAEKELEVGEDLLFMGDYHRGSGLRCGLEMRDSGRRPTAVFCANDEMAFGLMDAFHALGIKVPQDVSVVGFDDVALASSYRPPLTSVRQPIEEMSSAALQAVVEQVTTGHEVEGRLFYPELVVRGSTAHLSEEYIQ